MSEHIALPEATHNQLGEIASDLHDLQFPLRFMAKAVYDQLDGPLDDGFINLMDRLVADLNRLSDAVYSIHQASKTAKEVRANA